MSNTERIVMPDWAWRRHANPLSGWSRAATTPVVVYALYTRNWRLFGVLVCWILVNPVAFRPPETTDAWMTRGVLAEREWIGAGNGTVGTDWPNVLNLLNTPATAYLGWATLRKRPLHAILATVLVIGLKLWWITAIIGETGVQPGEPMPDW